MTLLDPMAVTDGPLHSKAVPVLKRATSPCNICRNLFRTSSAERAEVTFLLITSGFFAEVIALQKKTPYDGNKFFLVLTRSLQPPSPQEQGVQSCPLPASPL